MAQMLLEGDESKFSLITNSLMDAVIDLAQKAVRMYKQFLNPDEIRFSKFTSDFSTIVNWKRDLLIEDIDIVNKTKITTSDARRKQNVENLLQMGLFTNAIPIDAVSKARLIEQLDIGIPVDDLPIPDYADIKKARRENKKIVSENVAIQIDPYDNHEIHYKIHTDFIKSNNYRKIVIAKPEIDVFMREHIKQHFEFIEKRQMAIEAEKQAQQEKK